MSYKKEGKCCFCNKDYSNWGHNPEPLESESEGFRCCDDCNKQKVIPARLKGW